MRNPREWELRWNVGAKQPLNMPSRVNTRLDTLREEGYVNLADVTIRMELASSNAREGNLATLDQDA